jgi:predicted AAA+ superfamily ATPase
MYITREIEGRLRKAAVQFPLLAITGPRQSGKSTVAQRVFPNHTYVSLEYPDVLRLAEEDPRALLARGPMILDEVQRCPQLFSYLQGIVDREKKKGHFILTGSAQFLLLESISQSLAGRVALFQLLPLSLAEIAKHTRYQSWSHWAEYALFGSYPALYEQNDFEPDITLFYQSYIQTFLQRDVRQIVNVTSLSDFDRFLRLFAGRVGCVFDIQSMANDLGVSRETVKRWIAVLETAMVIYRLEPYFENFGKRVIKSPKFYFTDTGLLTNLLGISTVSQLDRDPLRGSIFESLVVSEIVKSRLAASGDSKIYFYRDSNQHEVDVIMPQGRQLQPIEIKSSLSLPSSDQAAGLNYFRKLTGERCTSPVMVYGGAEEHQSESIGFMPWKNLASFNRPLVTS